MSKDPLPNSTKKQKLLHDPRKTPEDLAAIGELFFEAGCLYDAAAFFRKASFNEGLERLRRQAIAKADSFLYQVLVKDLNVQGVREQWDTIGKRAMELSKFSHAVRAFRQSGNEDARKNAEEATKALLSKSDTNSHSESTNIAE